MTKHTHPVIFGRREAECPLDVHKRLKDEGHSNVPTVQAIEDRLVRMCAGGQDWRGRYLYLVILDELERG